MQKADKPVLILFSMVLILSLGVSSVSAVDMDHNNIPAACSDDVNSFCLDYLIEEPDDNSYILCSDSSFEDGARMEEKSNEDFSKDDFNNLRGAGLKRDSKSSSTISLSPTIGYAENSIHYIDEDNLTLYFVDGVLSEEFNNSILIFSGEFPDKGILDIKSSNLTVIGNNSLFNNTVFGLKSDNIMISGINFVLDKEFAENDYAGILVLGDNCTVYNCTMNYTVPKNTNGFCVYSEGDVNNIQNFTLINNTFNFIGNNHNGGWDYGVFIDSTENAMVYGNSINCSLPLRAVNWALEIFGGVSMDTVGAFVSQSSNNLTLSNNAIYTHVSGGGTNYPTLDTVLIYDCMNVIIENNSIYSEDFDSKNGKDNYLQGIDLYFVNDVMILNNQIHIRTTGGRGGMGTAYPIQVSGPYQNVTIAYNNLSTVNFGPNCGIYSHNFYGPTGLYIISNFINVTGIATSDSWALVTGIEVQDTNDVIWNNTIIVNNMGNYSDNYAVYGISFSQTTRGDHTYNIQYNNVTTNGKYAVLLSGRDSAIVLDSIVANNVLNSKNKSGNQAVRIGNGVNYTIRNNTDGVFRNALDPDDLPDWLKNHRGVIPNIDVLRYFDDDSHGSGLTDNKGYGTAPWNVNGSSGGIDGHGRSRVSGNGSNPNSDSILVSNRDTAPGIGGSSSPSISASNLGDGGSSAINPNAYELDEHESIVDKSSNTLQLAVICILALLLIGIGYNREKDKEEEE